MKKNPICMAVLLLLIFSLGHSQTRLVQEQIRNHIIEVGDGLQITTPFPSDTAPVRLNIDTLYIVHLAGFGELGKPVVGQPCYNGPGMWFSQDAIYLCCAIEDWPTIEKTWTWRKINWSK